MRSRVLAALATLLVAFLVGSLLAGAVAVGHAQRLDAETVKAIIARGQRTPAPSATAPPLTPQPTVAFASPTTLPSASPTPRPSPAAAPRPPLPADPLLALTWPRRRADVGRGAPVEPAPTPRNEALAARLATITVSEALATKAPYGVAVVDNWGRAVYDHNGDLPLLPASTNKLVVAAAALRTFPADLQLVTALAATDGPDTDGVVHGDLVLVGGADPTLVSPTYAEVDPQRPATPIAGLVESVRAAGITSVEGRVLAEPGIFAHDLEPQGWIPRYFDTLDGTRIAGLTVDVGRHLLVREHDDALLGVAADDPALEAARVLTDLLVEAGVDVAGAPALATTDDPDAVARADARVVATVESPPLSTLLAHMVRRSDNHMADTIFRLLGAVGADGTWGGASRAVHRALDPLGLDWTGVRLSDGSGLSRTDRLTASFLADLDEAMMSTADAPRWREVMAVAGQTGTLRGRYRGTPANGAVHGKTGALRDVRALAGSVDGPSTGDVTQPYRYHFAIVGNELTGADAGRLRRIMDLVVLALAADLRGCGDWMPPTPPAEPAASEPPPEAAVCP